jgi:hypothetical protein
VPLSYAGGMDTAYSWTCTDAHGEPMTDSALGGRGFPDQAEAEAWLTEEWQTLADAGVVEVTLRYGDEVVYGPMSLAPPP